MTRNQWIALFHAGFAGRVTAVLLALPVVARAVVAVMIKKGYAAIAQGVPQSPGY